MSFNYLLKVMMAENFIQTVVVIFLVFSIFYTV